VKAVCTMVYMLYPSPKVNIKDDDWGTVKLVLLSDTQMMNNLVSYDVSKLKSEPTKVAY